MSSSTNNINYPSKTAEIQSEIIQNLRSNLDRIVNKLTELEKSDELDSIAVELQNLDSNFSENTSNLSGYDVKNLQRDVLAAKELYQEIKEKLTPKKKFGFRNKKKTSSITTSTKAVETNETNNKKPFSKLTEFQEGEKEALEYKNLNDETIVLNDKSALDLRLSNLKNCRVHILSSPSTVHMTNLENCQILSCPVRTSIFIDDCFQSDFVVACQQLRTHRTKKSNFYLHVTSRAIIEDCHDVYFAPYNLDITDNLADHFNEAQLNQDVNNWDKVDDFNWLSSDKPSPNWSILPLEKRKNTWKN